MLKYDIFYRNSVVRRTGDLGSVKSLSDQKELPSGATVHLLDNIATLNPAAPVIPDTENPFYSMLPVKKMMFNQQAFSVENPMITPDLTGITPISMGINKELKEFRAANSGVVRFVDSTITLPSKSTVQSIINYNPLVRVRMTGRFKGLRLYRAIMDTVLNNVAKNSDRDHIIHLPLSDLVFTRPDFIKSFTKQDKMSVKYPEVSHYLIMMDILAYIEATSEEGVFNKVPEDMINKITLALTNGNKVIYYRLDTLKEINGAGNSALMRVIKQMNTLSESAVVLDDPLKEKPIPEPVLQVNVSETPSNVTGIIPNVSKETIAQSTKEYLVELETVADERIDNDPSLTPAQKERAKKVARAWKDIDIGGVPLTTIMAQGNDQSIDDNTLDFMKDMPDASMAISSVANLNPSYMKKMFAKDLASSVLAFNGQGMYLTDISGKDTSDEFNGQVEYTAKFEDANGKRHTIRFTLPKVDASGQCMINGTLKSMRLQRVNTPICKISPTRVSLNSYAGKQLVERNTAKAHSFYESFKRALSKAEENAYSFSGDAMAYEEVTLPYDYTEIAKNHTKLVTTEFEWNFDYKNRYDTLSPQVAQTVAVQEEKHGVFLGTGGSSGNILYFINIQCVLTRFDTSENKVAGYTTMLDEVVQVLDVKVPHFHEWVTLSVLNKKIPVIFALCYRFGFTHMLEYLNVDYDTYGPRERVSVSTSDIILRFNDKKLIIKGTPKHVGLLFGGMSVFDLRETSIEEMDGRDIYFDMMQDLRLSLNYLRGVDAMFDGFIDPITRDVLIQMGEPTTVKDLLIRATVLLTTTEHMEAASAANHRFRSYERMAGTVYNKLHRALTAYNNSGASAKTFSISPYEVSQAIVTDPLMRNVETLNPITAAKEMCGVTHIGEGGRSSETFVIKDRQYTEDNIGIISEATVDSGKVAVDVQTSVNPNIISARGLTQSKPVDELGPAELLSTTALLMPFATRNDGKR